MFGLVSTLFLPGGAVSSILMGNISAASILGVGTVELKLTSRKTVHLKNV
jgi:hypothetical protein